MSRLFLALSVLTLISACGVQGDLERPNPLWGGQHAIDVECRRERNHHETLDGRCKPAAAPTTTSPAVSPAPVTPPASPTSPDTTTTTTSTTTPSNTP